MKFLSRLFKPRQDANIEYIRELEANVARLQLLNEAYVAQIEDKTNQIGRLRSSLWKVKRERDDWRQRLNEAKSRARRRKF